MSNSIAAFSIDAAGVAPVTTKLLFSIPFEDSREFNGLPQARRQEINLTFGLLRRIHEMRGSGNYVRLTDELAQSYRHIRGMSGVSLRKKYALYAQDGEWRSLIRNYKAPSSQPREFVEFLRKLAEENNKSIDAALDKIRHEIWPSGSAVPGYGTWMEFFVRQFPMQPLPRSCPRAFFPTGWSKRNLRRYSPNKGERLMFQRGLGAAKPYYPSVKRDPSQLRPMELIVVDDFLLETMCIFRDPETGKAQICEVAGLVAIDVATRRRLAWGIGPRIEREEAQPDGSVRKIRTGITRDSVQGLMHQLLGRHGLPSYEVTFLVEKGTASVSDDLELSLDSLFDGQIRIDRTNTIENKTLTNGFTERGGRPWEKGWVESDLNYIQNVIGDIQGHRGSNARLNGPAYMDEMVRYAKVLLGQGNGQLNLPADKMAELRLPFLSVEQIEKTMEFAFARADSRTEHKMLGFDEVTEFRLQPGESPRPMIEMAMIPMDQQTGLEIVNRKESPMERWGRLCAAHPRRPIEDDVLALLLLTPKAVTYTRNQITFTHQGRGYTYVDKDGSVLGNMKDGTELLGYFTPSRPQSLHLSTLKRAYVGTIDLLGGRQQGVDVRDKDAIREAAAWNNEIFNRGKANVRRRHADREAELLHMREHNEAIKQAHLSTLPPGASSTPISTRFPEGEPTGIAHKMAAAPVAQSLGASIASAQETEDARIREVRLKRSALARAETAGAAALTDADLTAAAARQDGEQTLSDDEAADLMAQLRRPEEI